MDPIKAEKLYLTMLKKFAMTCKAGKLAQCFENASLSSQQDGRRGFAGPVWVVQIEEGVLSELVVAVLCLLLEVFIHNLKQ